MAFIATCLYLFFYLGGLLHRATWWPVAWTLLAYFPLSWLARQSLYTHDMEVMYLAAMGGFFFGVVTQSLRISWQRRVDGHLVYWPVILILGGPVLMGKDYGLIDLTRSVSQWLVR